MIPPVTVLHYTAIGACVGFRSSRLCNITNQHDDPIYTNVYFDFLGAGYPGSSINRKLEDTMRIPSTRIVIFKRNNLFRLRTQIVEIDNNLTIKRDGVDVPFQRTWMVEEIDQSGNVQVLTISSNQDN